MKPSPSPSPSPSQFLLFLNVLFCLVTYCIASESSAINWSGCRHRQSKRNAHTTSSSPSIHHGLDYNRDYSVKPPQSSWFLRPFGIGQESLEDEIERSVTSIILQKFEERKQEETPLFARMYVIAPSPSPSPSLSPSSLPSPSRSPPASLSLSPSPSCRPSLDHLLAFSLNVFRPSVFLSDFHSFHLALTLISDCGLRTLSDTTMDDLQKFFHECRPFLKEGSANFEAITV